MTLSEIAAAIDVRLSAFESDPAINRYEIPRGDHGDLRPYFIARAWAAGRWVNVQYIAYQGCTSLNKKEAEEYLAWLTAGNIGPHFHMKRKDGRG